MLEDLWLGFLVPVKGNCSAIEYKDILYNSAFSSLWYQLEEGTHAVSWAWHTRQHVFQPYTQATWDCHCC